MIKKGFTLIEMIVVLTIIVITSLIAVPSVLNYMQRAEQSNRTETAKLIYLTAQNQLTQIRALGNLKSAYGAEISGQYFTTDAEGKYTDELIDALKGENNVHDILTDVYYPATDIENGEADHVRYLSKPVGYDPDHPLTQLLEPGIRDERILEGAILLEYNILTGKILSVFYSDLDNVTELVYSDLNGVSSNIIGPRAELYDDIANDRRQGYYGVNYTGSVAPEQTFQIAINIYDGYDDGEDDTAILPGISRFNKTLDTINNRNNGGKLENVLYAEIFIEKSLLEKTPTPTFNLSLSAFADPIVENLELSGFNPAETFEDVIEMYDDGVRPALIYRNDSPTGDPDFARFIWVLDYVGGDISSENDERYKYSITSLVDINGNTADLSDVSGITASIIESNNVAAEEFISNEKHPFFADDSDLTAATDPTAYIATSRHLNNMRHINDTEDNIYSQIEDIYFDADDGFIEIDTAFADSELADDSWTLKMSPLPTLRGSYTALYSEGATTGVHTINDLFIYNVNKDTDAAEYTDVLDGVINRSVGLFETIAATGEVSHLTIIDPYVEVKNTVRYWPGPTPDEGKYAGVITGYSNGGISHITISSDRDYSPVYDLDNGTNSEADYGNVANDYVGGVVGFVGDDISENAINHILYLAVAPYEEMGSYHGNRVRYDFPIIGEYLATTPAATSNATRAIDEDSCYYLVGDAIRPTEITLIPQINSADAAGDPTSSTTMNTNTITYGYGKAISTNDIYSDMKNPDSDFYKNFVLNEAGTAAEYSFVATVTNPLDDTTVSSLQYPYPYFGNTIPNRDGISNADVLRELDFVWPIAELEPFEAEFIYYEVYGNALSFSNPEIGTYQIDETGNILVNTLKDINSSSQYRILSDGYAIKVNRPTSMLNTNDIIFTVNDVEIAASSITNWLNYYPENLRYDEFTDLFRADPDSTDTETLLSINNSTFSNAVNNSTYNDTTDVLALKLSDGRTDATTWYINPLFAKSIYTTDATDPEAMVYSIRSARHINSIGYFANSESASSNFYQEVDINLAKFGDVIGRYPTEWSYTIANPWVTYGCLKYGSGVGSWSNLFNSGSVSAINYPFEGSYDGNGKTISNLSRSGTTSNVGLFEVIGDSGEVYDLTLDNFTMTSNGLAVAGVVAAENRGTIRDVTVRNTDVLATFSTYGTTGGGIAYNRPSEVGGVVADNLGVIENVIVENSTITRHEVGSVLAYGIRSHGAGGIAGSNGGTIENSAVINTTVTAYDNFIGGIVGISIDGGIIRDNLFVNNQVDSSGNPISPVRYDTTATLTSENPRYTIGGIVGGIVYAETIATGNYVEDEGIVDNNLYLAVAPSADTDADTIPDTIYPVSGVRDGGFTVSDNIYLTGAYYSANNINFKAYNYNTLAVNGAPITTEVVGYDSSLINLDFLQSGTNISFENWFDQIANDYPVPIEEIILSSAPFTTNRPKQHALFEGNGYAELPNNLSAEMNFDGERVNYALAGENVLIELDIRNLTAIDYTADNLTRLEITISDYADYLDVASLTDNSAVLSLYDNIGDEIVADLPYSYNETENIITVDTSSLAGINIVAGEKVTVRFAIAPKSSFTTDIFTVAVPTDYLYIALKANISLATADGVRSVEVVSDKLYISHDTIITTTVNGDTLPIPNTGEEIIIDVETILQTTDFSGYSRDGYLIEYMPSGFAVVDNSVIIEIDGTAIASPTLGVDYTININNNETLQTDDDYVELTVLNLTQTSTVKLGYKLSYTGADTQFTIREKYNANILQGGKPYSIMIINDSSVFSIETAIVP